MPGLPQEVAVPKKRWSVGAALGIVSGLLAGGCHVWKESILAATEPAPTNVWIALMEVTPLPHGGPLPATEASPLDGTYAYFNPAPPQWWSCLRCADYRPAGGAWRLGFEHGVMRIYYEVTGWHSLASYRVDGERLYLYNDPYCKEEVGEYRWESVDGALSLQLIEDPCSFGLRGQNLSAATWQSCADEDPDPARGCTDPVASPETAPSQPAGLQVQVIRADVRLSEPVPEVLAYPNYEAIPPPAGVRFGSSERSLPYGNNRVLWAEGDWLEATADASYTSMGVQFRGDYVIGWARVLFDGQEIWRGDTARIWSELKVHGGYVSVSGFAPGEHTLRVERLDLDTRPVVVAFFGFDR